MVSKRHYGWQKCMLLHHWDKAESSTEHTPILTTTGTRCCSHIIYMHPGYLESLWWPQCLWHKPSILRVTFLKYTPCNTAKNMKMTREKTQSRYLRKSRLFHIQYWRDSCWDSPCSPQTRTPHTSLRQHCNASGEKNHDMAQTSLEPYSDLKGHKIKDKVWSTVKNCFAILPEKLVTAYRYCTYQIASVLLSQ